MVRSFHCVAILLFAFFPIPCSHYLHLPGIWLSSSVTTSLRPGTLEEYAVLTEGAGSVELRAAMSSLVVLLSAPVASLSSSVP